MKKLIFVIASKDFQIIEYETPKAVLEKAGIVVVTVSDVGGEAVASSGKKVKVDLTCRDALQCVSTVS